MRTGILRPGGAALLLLLLAALLPGCARREAAADAPALRISQRNEPATLDPALAALPDEFFILRALSEGLVAPDPDGGPPVPAAAARWTVSPDGRTYTFHLRPGARWSNGEPVTAGDFLASYRRVLTPATAAPKAALFFLVAGAEDFYRGRLSDFAQTGFGAPDDATLVVRLARPAPEFLAHAASGPWLPVNPRVVARHGSDWTRPGNFVGNGPFLLEAWQPNRRIVVRRRADYWDAARVLAREIQFVAFDNGDAEERAFRAGQVDVTLSVPPHRIATYAAEQPSRLRRVPLHETRYLSFNTRRGPLADARVRRALSLAIDRRAIVDRVLLGDQRPARTFVDAGLAGYTPPEAADGGPDEARRLLAAAGFPGGRGFPRLVLGTWTNVPVLESIQAMWRNALGVEVELLQREARVHLAALGSGDYDIAFMTSIPDVADPADVLGDFRAGHPGNYPQWSDAAFDAAFAAAEAAPDAAARLARLADAERRLLAEQPVAPLYFNTKNFLIAPSVHGWREDSLWTRFYKDVGRTAP